MNLPDLSIKKPVFISCIVILTLVAGVLALLKMPVDLYPNVDTPYVSVSVQYTGAGPQEIETLISKVIEDELTSISGVKEVSSTSLDGNSNVTVEFNLDVDLVDAQQQVREKVSSIRRKLPDDIEEPTIRRFNSSDQPILGVTLAGSLNQRDLYDIADDFVKPLFQQVNDVSTVDIYGARKREIQVQLDKKKLKEFEISATEIVQKIGLTGVNIPVGKVDDKYTETLFRTLGEYKDIQEIENIVIKFLGNDIPIRVKDVAEVKDTVEDETSRSSSNGQRTIMMMISRQSGANTVAVAKNIKKQIEIINEALAKKEGNLKLTLVRDNSVSISDNIYDVTETIIIGMILAILVVFLFLGNIRSTIITGVAIPNSLIGAFIFIGAFGFSVNTLTLLALTLSVGILIDDAIVVRENIFRFIEMGEDAKSAASKGTREVTLAVIATTLTVMAVFGSLAFVEGMTGRFLREFGLTVCFSLIVSLFDGLAVAPMLSAYFSGRFHKDPTKKNILEKISDKFGKYNEVLEVLYERVLIKVIAFPKTVLSVGLIIFILGSLTFSFIPKTFMPPGDGGELSVNMDLEPGSSLSKTQEVADLVEKKIEIYRKDFVNVSKIIGSRRGSGSNSIMFFLRMKPMKQRKISTSEMKEKIRELLVEFEQYRPIVKDSGGGPGATRPFTLNIRGTNLDLLKKTSKDLAEIFRKDKRFKDVDLNFREGRPEFKIALKKDKFEAYGVSTALIGNELRTLMEGTVAAKFRVEGREYDVRVRLQEKDRDLKTNFSTTYVPNLNGRLVALSNIAQGTIGEEVSQITRKDRAKYIEISADLAKGIGVGDVVSSVTNFLNTEYKLPEGVTFTFSGEGKDFIGMASSMTLAAILAVLFIYLVLSSLYNSFIVPFSIMLALPLALCGAFAALWMFNESINLFSIISCIMLLGIATKNSILLVDYTQQLQEGGMERIDAIIAAGKRRLRPILMTSLSLVAGAIPLAIGLNAASAQRTSMGVAMVGGVLSSTFLTLLVIPASYSYLERFNKWALIYLRKFNS